MWTLCMGQCLVWKTEFAEMQLYVKNHIQDRNEQLNEKREPGLEPIH